MTINENRTALLSAATELQRRAGDLLLHHLQQVREFSRTKPNLSREEQELACQHLEALRAKVARLLLQATLLRNLGREAAEHDLHTLAEMLQ